MADFLTTLRFIGAFIGVWSLVSVVAVAVLIPWFRVQARMNVALSSRSRREDWLIAAHSPEHRPAADR
jgi:hypothetical protein